MSVNYHIIKDAASEPLTFATRKRQSYSRSASLRHVNTAKVSTRATRRAAAAVAIHTSLIRAPIQEIVCALYSRQT